VRHPALAEADDLREDLWGRLAAKRLRDRRAAARQWPLRRVDELLGAILRWTMTAGEHNAQGKKERCLDALRRIQGFAADAIEELKRS
jgi:hypothetical protein